MKYLKLKDEIVLIDNIIHVQIRENTIEILYNIVSKTNEGSKFYGHILDYSEVKNDVNEEKTKIEQDYEKIINKLNDEDNFDKIIKSKNIKINDLMNDLYKSSETFNEIYKIINSLATNKHKINKIKEILKK